MYRLPQISILAFIAGPLALSAAPPVDSVVVFNELMYHPTDALEAGEWIELHNQMGINVDLSDWELTGGINYTFPDGTVIPGGGHVVVAKTPAMVAGSLGPWTGSLNNNGETIRLRDKNGRLMDELDYSDSGSWPVGADGGGVALAKKNRDAASGPAENWTVSAQTGGTPGGANFPPPPAPVNGTLFTFHSAWKYLNTGTDPGAAWKEESFDDSAWPTGTAAFDFGNTSIYDPYPGGPPATGGNAEVTGVTIAGVSSQATAASRAAIRCIDGSGLTNGLHTKTATNTMWQTNGTGLTPTDPLPAHIIFDLGSSQNLTSVRVWNYNEFGASSQTNRGSRAVQISVAATAGGPFTNVGSPVELTQASGTDSEAGQSIPLLQNGVRQVRFDITSNWGNTSQFTGLSEVKFYNDQPAVPPPPPEHRATLTAIPNTGFNTDGTPVTPGQRDPNYINTADGLGAFVQNGHPAWMAVDGVSNWIGLTAAGTDNVAFGTFTYRLNFDLTNWKKETAAIQFYASVDNDLNSVALNGTTLAGISGSGFTSYLGPFNIPAANLLNGANTFDIVWTNASTAVNPAGVRTKWVATAAPILRRTALASNPVTTRYRKKFTWNGNPAASYQLRLEHLIDDGAVFYLNGQEVLRTNMPAGAVTNSTPASTDVIYPMFSGLVNLPSSAFHTGENTLAVEVHQAASGGADAVFGARMDITETPPAPAASVALTLHEVAAATAPAGAFFIELRNGGSTTLDLTGYRVRSSGGAEAVLGSTTLAAGALLALDETTLGFRPLDGDKLFLLPPAATAVMDAAVVKNKAQARTATGVWQVPSASTAGSANTFSISDAIVINEIMFAHIPVYAATGKTDDPEEWVELFNRTLSAVDLSGWALKGDADFTFVPGTVIPSGGYLVVARDRLALAAKFPAATIVGDWTGSLPNSGATVRLEDAAGNTVNEVRYYSGGRWDWRAGSGGSSLELKNPFMDNAQPEAWAGSDESSKSVWQTFSYSGTATPPAGSNDPTNYNEFIAGLLADGEFLLDDVSVTTGATQLIQNGNFGASPNPVSTFWRLLGTHGSHGRSIAQAEPGNAANMVLKVVATGPTEHMHNHLETTLKAGASFHTIASASTYNISFRAKWISGCPRLNTRLYFNRLNRQHLLPVPMNNGTPGALNSRYSATIAPTLHTLSHSPVLPASGEAVTVRVRSAARVPVTAATLKWKKDGTASFTDTAMTQTGSGEWEAVIPGQTAGSLVQFYVSGSSASGAVANFPAAGTASRAMIKWKDTVAPTGPGYGFRILMPVADADFMHLNTNVMSNDYLPCTVVYRESEVYYDAGVRLKSSQRGRLGDARLGFAVIFDPMQKLRGVHEGINMDRSAYGPGTTGSGTGQADIIEQIFAQRAGGVPAMYNDMVYLMAPRVAHNGSAQMTMAEFNDVYLDSQWDNGADQPTFKFDLIYFPTSTVGGTPEGLKIAQPDDVRGVNIGAYTGSSKEDYRWNYIIGNARQADDYSGIINLNTAFRLLSQGNSSQVATAIDVDQWLRTSASMALTNSNDSYSTGGLPHNIKLYTRADGRVLYLPWDADFSKMSTSHTVEGNADLQRIVAANPVWRRWFYGHLYDIVSTSYNTTYLTPWVDHLKTYNTAGGDWNAILTYVAARAAYVLGDINSKYPAVTFAITTNSGNNFSTASAVTSLAGNAWINVRRLRLAGAPEDLVVTWSGASGWSVNLPILPGANAFTIEAVNHQGAVVATDTITITGTGAVLAADASNIVVSELHYHPADPSPAEITAGYTDADDFEYVELRNISASNVNAGNCRFENGLTYTIAAGTIIPAGGTLVIPRRSAAFALRHPGVSTAAQYYVASGNTLSNGGEQITLLDAGGNDIKRFTYDDTAPWPTAPDGLGNSLVLIAPLQNPDHNHPLNWRSSIAAGGTPGGSDALPAPALPLGDDDGDGLANILQYAAGGTPVVTFDGSSASFIRDLRADVPLELQTATDLSAWSAVPPESWTREALPGNKERITIFFADPFTDTRRYIRWRAIP